MRTIKNDAMAAADARNQRELALASARRIAIKLRDLMAQTPPNLRQIERAAAQLAADRDKALDRHATYLSRSNRTVDDASETEVVEFLHDAVFDLLGEADEKIRELSLSRDTQAAIDRLGHRIRAVSDSLIDIHGRLDPPAALDAAVFDVLGDQQAEAEGQLAAAVEDFRRRVDAADPTCRSRLEEELTIAQRQVHPLIRRNLVLLAPGRARAHAASASIVDTGQTRSGSMTGSTSSSVKARKYEFPKFTRRPGFIPHSSAISWTRPKRPA